MTEQIKVFDRYGVQQDWAWLVANYGNIVVHPAADGPGWRIVEIWENADTVLVEGDKAHAGTFIGIEAAPIIMVQAQAVDGAPEGNIPVAWYWPNAPYDPEAGPENGLPEGMIPERCDGPGFTNDDGNVGFAMGTGAYYDPATGIGPHAVWIYGVATNSDVLFGLGMIAGTNHNSLWPVYRWVDDPTPPPPGCPVDEIKRLLDKIEGTVGVLADMLPAVRTGLKSIKDSSAEIRGLIE